MLPAIKESRFQTSGSMTDRQYGMSAVRTVRKKYKNICGFCGKKGEKRMKQGECWCNDGKVVDWLWDKDKEPVIGIDGDNAMLRVRISKEQGRVGLPIDFCPFCSRKLVDEEGYPRCPENLNAKEVKE